jgi:C-terminal processing protease CtpA/Prc
MRTQLFLISLVLVLLHAQAIAADDSSRGIVIGNQTWTKPELDRWNPEYRTTGLVIARSKELIYVRLVLPNSPAQRAGVLPDDRIMLVGTNSVTSMSLGEIGRLFLGGTGTVVKVAIKRPGENALRSLEIVLGDVQLPHIDEQKDGNESNKTDGPNRSPSEGSR